MADSLSSLRQRPVPTRLAAAESFDDEAGDDLGPCAARAKMKMVAALTLKFPDRPWESYQYAGLATRNTYDPATRFEVVFHDDRESWRVAVTGRNLEAIYLNLISHRIDWLRPADHDFSGDGEPIVLAVRVFPVGPERARPTPSVSTKSNRELTTEPA